jgi:hypothetical protein
MPTVGRAASLGLRILRAEAAANATGFVPGVEVYRK